MHTNLGHALLKRGGGGGEGQLVPKSAEHSIRAASPQKKSKNKAQFCCNLDSWMIRRDIGIV